MGASYSPIIICMLSEKLESSCKTERSGRYGSITADFVFLFGNHLTVFEEDLNIPSIFSIFLPIYIFINELYISTYTPSTSFLISLPINDGDSL